MVSADTVINTIKGHKWDVDGTDDFDCVDVAKKADRMYHPGTTWAQTGIHGNGRQIFGNASSKYYTKIKNDHSNVNQLPKKGDIICFDATPKAGFTNKYSNPYGHVALVVDPMTSSGQLKILMQASGTGRAAYYDTHSWRYRPVQGWLRPIDPKPSLLDQLKAQVKSLTSKLSKSTDEAADLKAANKLLNTAVAKERKTVTELTTKLEAKQKEVDQADDANAALLAEVNHLKGDKAELGRVVANLQAKLTACGESHEPLTNLQLIQLLIKRLVSWANKFKES